MAMIWRSSQMGGKPTALPFALRRKNLSWSGALNLHEVSQPKEAKEWKKPDIGKL